MFLSGTFMSQDEDLNSIISIEVALFDKKVFRDYKQGKKVELKLLVLGLLIELLMMFLGSNCGICSKFL